MRTEEMRGNGKLNVIFRIICVLYPPSVQSITPQKNTINQNFPEQFLPPHFNTAFPDKKFSE